MPLGRYSKELIFMQFKINLLGTNFLLDRFLPLYIYTDWRKILNDLSFSKNIRPFIMPSNLVDKSDIFCCLNLEEKIYNFFVIKFEFVIKFPLYFIEIN